MTTKEEEEVIISANQNEKTLEFWDTFYKTSVTDGELEWITSDAPLVLDKILSLYPTSQQQLRILEIGCGVSILSRSLLERILQTAEGKSQHAYEFVSTDVSSVCLEHNRSRDAAFISSLPGNASLSYAELNVVKELEPCQINKYSVVLDKGTCDTFLFRSKRKQKGSSAHAPLLKSLLNNVHRMLRADCQAKYILISPRSKLKSVRDFNGFASVNRIRMSTALLGDALLVKSNAECNTAASRKHNSIYIYECTRNDLYNPDNDEPFLEKGTLINDDSICEKCKMTFKSFRGKIDMKDQGEIHWTRRFRNHTIHCKGNNSC